MPARGTRVEVNYRWLLLLASVVPVLLLRGHRTALVVYAGVLTLALFGVLLWLPRRVADTERRFSRDSLRLLAQGDFAGLEALAARQRLLGLFGRRHLIPETQGLAAAAQGRHEDACQHFRRALEAAGPDERLRIEVNLAGEEVAAGRLDEAEGHYRTVLRRRPDMPLALGALGRVLVRKATEQAELEEAAELLRRALPMADSREVPLLRLALAEALLRAKAPGATWREELDLARDAGADPAELTRVEALA